MSSGPLFEKLSDLPEGVSRQKVSGTHYQVNKCTLVSGSVWVEAYSLGSKDYISFNFYPQLTINQLKPCEMPLEKINTWLNQLEVN